MKSKGIIAIVVGVVLLVLLRWVVGRMDENQRAEARVAQAVLAQDTVDAARDTSRALSIEGVLGDSLRAAQRRAVQVEQRADKLDATLKLERVAREQLEASVVALRATVKSDTVYVTRGAGVGRSAGESMRHAAFDTRQAPYTVHADVSLPEPPAPGRMEVRVELDTLALDVRVGCGDAGSEGVRPASVTVVGPAWALMRLSRVEQAPSVCSASSRTTASERWSAVRRFVERFGVSVGYAAARSSTGAVIAGPGLAAGFRVWP
jgi:type II secretory pathway pseudopilin PulG